jgi:hypothetical protein
MRFRLFPPRADTSIALAAPRRPEPIRLDGSKSNLSAIISCRTWPFWQNPAFDVSTFDAAIPCGIMY